MQVRNGFAFVLALCLAGAAAAQERTITVLGSEQLEQMLRGMNLEFKKTASQNVAGNFFYDFSITRNKYSSRLHYFQGKDIMIDALFPDHPLETLNRWNARTKFTRAVSYKSPKGAYAALEANLDISGGISENAVRRFLQIYEKELVAFDKFLAGGKGEDLVPIGPEGDKVLNLTPDKLDELLRKVRIAARKQDFKGGTGSFYDYESKNFKIRLTSFQGKELMLDAVFKKLPLETINKYNYEQKFIRAVLRAQGNTEYTALEANLDCSAGVSENMIRHFMVTFDEEIQTFVEFINKNN